MKKVALTVFCTFILFDFCYSQLSTYNLDRLNNKSIRITKRYYVKYARLYETPKLIAYIERRDLEFIPIVSFKLKKSATDYDDTSKIVEHLKRHSRSKISEAIFYKQGVYQGSMICGDLVYGYGKDCFYGFDDIDTEFKANYQNTYSRNLFWFLQSEKPDFIFTIKMIRGVFYVKDDKIFFINPYEKMYSPEYKNGTTTIYDPDQFIREKCSVEIIREIARNKKGSRIRFCN